MAKTYNGNSIQLEVDCGDGGVSEAMKNNDEISMPAEVSTKTH